MFLEVQGITKQFYGNTVLNSVSIGFEKGEVHALAGENGAGKSTLIKIIGGNYASDGGSVLIDGKKAEITSPHQASLAGISIVYQEYNLVKNLTVLENIVLGKEPVGKFGKIDWNKARRDIMEIAERDHIKIDLDKYAGDLSSAEAKIAEILKAYAADMRVLILDEPTAALDDDDVNALFSLIDILKSRGVTIIYISHRLDEIFRICDRVSILKDGQFVGTWKTKEINNEFLINSMVGRELKDIFPPGKPRDVANTETILSVSHLTDGRKFHDISFDLHKGEILGIGGMTGHGQRELIRALFGYHPVTEGTITLEGKQLQIKSPRQAIKNGLAFLSDDRRNEGLALTQPILRNVAYPSLKKRSTAGVINSRKQLDAVCELMEQLDVKMTSVYQNAQGLSGGNQQRLVLAKWLPLNPKVLLFHEPTLGVDVGAKAEMYRLLRKFTDRGISILMVTSDMLELLHVSDRICVFYEGKIQTVIDSEGATEAAVMAAATGRKLSQ